MAGAGKIANLSVGVSLDEGEFKQGLGKAEAAAVRFSGALRARGASLGTSFAASVTGPLAAGFAAFSVASFAKSAIDALDAFNDLKDATGASIENISALDDVARRTGSSFEVVETSLIKLNRAMNEGADSDAGRALRALGLDMAALRKLDTAQQFVEVAKALNNYEDSATKGQYTTALFGKSLLQVSSLLKDVAERGKLAAASTTEMSEEAEAFNKHLAGWKANIEGGARALMGDLLPALNAVLAKFNEGGLTAAIDEFGNKVFNWQGNQLNKQIRSLTDDLADLRKEAAAIDGGFWDRFTKLGGVGAISTSFTNRESLTAQIKARTAELEKVQAELAKLNAPPPGPAKPAPFMGPPAPSLEDLNKVAEREKAAKDAIEKAKKDAEDSRKRGQDTLKRQAEEVDRYVDALRKQAEATEELTELEQARRAVARGDLKPKDDADEARIYAAAEATDKLVAARKRLADVNERAEYTENLMREANEKFAREGAALAESLITPMERYTQQMERLHALYAANKLGENRDEVFRRASDKYGQELKDAKGALDQVTEFSKQAARNIQDALADALENGFNGSLKDMAQSWLELLRKMAAQALAARLGQQLFGSGKEGDEGWLGSLIKTGAQYFFGGSTGAPPASNGAAYPAAVGIESVPYDNFPALLHRGEQVVPARYATREKNTGGNVTINNHGQDVKTRRDSRGNLEVTVRAMVEQTLTGDLSRGGPISRAQQRTFGLQRALDRR